MDFCAGTLQQLFHGLVRIFHKRLTQQCHFLEELLNTTTHHLFNDLGRLATFRCLGRENFFFLFNIVLRDFIFGNTNRATGCDVHGNVLAQCVITTFNVNHNANTRTMHVAGKIAFRVDQFKAAQAHILANLGDQRLAHIFYTGGIVIAD